MYVETPVNICLYIDISLITPVNKHNSEEEEVQFNWFCSQHENSFFLHPAVNIYRFLTVNSSRAREPSLQRYLSYHY